MLCLSLNCWWRTGKLEMTTWPWINWKCVSEKQQYTDSRSFGPWNAVNALLRQTLSASGNQILKDSSWKTKVHMCMHAHMCACVTVLSPIYTKTRGPFLNCKSILRKDETKKTKIIIFICRAYVYKVI